MQSAAQPPLDDHAAMVAVSGPGWRLKDYRVLWFATFFSGLGFRGESVVFGWLLLQSTRSSLMVGLGMGIRAAPNFAMGIVGGVAADRVDRRNLLRILGAAAATNTVVLVLATRHHVSLAAILVLTLLSGAIYAGSAIARQSYVVDLVGPHDAVGGVAFNSLGLQLGGVGGALLAGYCVTRWGVSQAYVGLTGCYALGAITTALPRSREPTVTAPSRFGATKGVAENVSEWMAEIRGNRPLVLLICLVAAVEILGHSYLSIQAVQVKQVLHSGAGSLGFIVGIAGLGGLLGSMGMTILGMSYAPGMLLFAVLPALGIATIALGESRVLYTALLATMAVSCFAAVTDILFQALIQLASPNAMRGRAAGAWTFAIGAGPVGFLAIGILAKLIGVANALLINGVALIMLACIALPLSRRLRQI